MTTDTTNNTEDDTIPPPAQAVAVAAEKEEVEVDAVVEIPLGNGEKTDFTTGTTTKSALSNSEGGGRQPPTYDKCIMIMAGIHTLFAALLFLWPFYIGKTSNGEGWDDLVRAIGAIMLVGAAMVIMTIVSICVGACRWNSLSRAMKFVTFYPLTLDILIVLILVILAKVNRVDNNSYDDDIVYPTYYSNETLAPKDGS